MGMDDNKIIALVGIMYSGTIRVYSNGQALTAFVCEINYIC